MMEIIVLEFGVVFNVEKLEARIPASLEKGVNGL